MCVFVVNCQPGKEMKLRYKEWPWQPQAYARLPASLKWVHGDGRVGRGVQPVRVLGVRPPLLSAAPSQDPLSQCAWAPAGSSENWGRLSSFMRRGWRAMVSRGSQQHPTPIPPPNRWLFEGSSVVFKSRLLSLLRRLRCREVGDLPTLHRERQMEPNTVAPRRALLSPAALSPWRRQNHFSGDEPPKARTPLPF